MRRISLALALIGAVAAAGCSGGAKKSSDNGGAPGVAEGTFTVVIQNGQAIGGAPANPSLAITGGYVTSIPEGINCGAGGRTACSFDFPLGTPVALTATVVAPNMFLGWAGDCFGEAGCDLAGNADKYIVAQFGTQRTGHPNWSDPALHGPQYNDAVNGVAGSLNCATCHGGQLQGQGIALSCAMCHPAPLPPQDPDAVAIVRGGHFDPTLEPWKDDGGWSQACQRCHTNQGFQDYIGALKAPGETTASDNHLDGLFLSTNTLTGTTEACTAAGTCTPGAYAYGPLQCETCHNPVSDPIGTGITTVRFRSSGAGFTNLTPTTNPLGLPTSYTVDKGSGTCVQCHQGRESSVSVQNRIGATATVDTVIGTGTFINPHYLGAAGTLFGSDAKMWAEYPGMIYTGRNEHGGVASCTFCHDAHSGQLPTDAQVASKCGTCHFDELSGAPVTTFLQIEDQRQFGFDGDIDGDAVVEPLKLEIEGLEAKLYEAMKVYSQNVGTTPVAICYNGASHPYYFKDNGNTLATGSVEAGIANDGICQADEMAGTTQRYNAFTPRLLRAAFNYKWAHAEPGAWAHNPRYAIEALYDGITDLNAGLSAALKVPFAGKRAFMGHFGGSEDASPYAALVYHSYAPMGFTSGACYQCHGGTVGFDKYIANPATPGWPADTSPATPAPFTAYQITAFECSVCHDYNGSTMKGIRNDVTTIYFPPQKPAAQQLTIDATTYFPTYAADRVCASCHSARESTLSVDATIGAATGWTLKSINPHYLGAAGVMVGTEGKAMYEYAGKTYTGKPQFFNAAASTTRHRQSCTTCHSPKGSKHEFGVDFAFCNSCHTPAVGDPHAFVGEEEELATLATELYTSIQAYAEAAVLAGTTGANRVCYQSAYPYWTKDSATPYGGACGTGDTGAPNMDPKLVKATYNYKWYVAEPGAFVHNFNYAAETLFDSIVDLGYTPSLIVGAPGAPTIDQVAMTATWTKDAIRGAGYTFRVAYDTGRGTTAFDVAGCTALTESTLTCDLSAVTLATGQRFYVYAEKGTQSNRGSRTTITVP